MQLFKPQRSSTNNAPSSRSAPRPQSSQGAGPSQAPSLEADFISLSSRQLVPPNKPDKIATILVQKRLDRYAMRTIEIAQDSHNFFRALSQISGGQPLHSLREWRAAICDQMQLDATHPLRLDKTPATDECLQVAAEVLNKILVVWPLRRAPHPDTYAPTGYTTHTAQVHVLLEHQTVEQGCLPCSYQSKHLASS